MCWHVPTGKRFTKPLLVVADESVDIRPETQAYLNFCRLTGRSQESACNTSEAVVSGGGGTTPGGEADSLCRLPAARRITEAPLRRRQIRRRRRACTGGGNGPAQRAWFRMV